MTATSLNLWIALALTLVVVIASVRQLRGSTTHPGRRWSVIALQVIVATLLYFCLMPPTRQQPAGGLVVLGVDAGKAGAPRPAKARCCCCPKLPMCPAHSAFPTWPPRCASIRPPR